MDLLGALGILVRVVETGSFSAVARERELSQAAVARQVSQLEEHFGVRLFHRTTRKLSLTDDGEMLLGLARPVLDGVDGLEAARAAARLTYRARAGGCHGGGEPPSRATSADLARRSSGLEGRTCGR